jgi:hypothetical protein
MYFHQTRRRIERIDVEVVLGWVFRHPSSGGLI